ncbi:MAG: hypothetical protein R8P61_34185 [Bacteroidia bacterium]|nr:hypothetical protein [Bacteroidia bacterium]
MDPFNQNDIDPLRNTDLMIAYLQDRAGEEDTQKIEELIESDELYRESMDALADMIAEGPELARIRIANTEAHFATALETAKENFVKEISQSHSNTDDTQSPGPGIPGWSFLGVIILLGIIGWIILSFQGGELHKAPETNLSALTDIQHVENFVTACGDDDKGIGSRNVISVNTAMMEQYAAENFNTAASQLDALSRNPLLDQNCQNHSVFYKAQSYLALGKREQASLIFEELLNGEGLDLKLRHASLWYLANLKLTGKQNDQARNLFKNLIESNEKNPDQHIDQLHNEKYLIDAEKYLSYLDG